MRRCPLVTHEQHTRLPVVSRGQRENLPESAKLEYSVAKRVPRSPTEAHPALRKGVLATSLQCGLEVGNNRANAAHCCPGLFLSNKPLFHAVAGVSLGQKSAIDACALSIICPIGVTYWSSILLVGLFLEYSDDRIIPTGLASLGGTAMAAGVQDINRSGTWLRSSRCSPDYNCVEVGRIGARVVIRDSKGKITLHALDSAQWMALLAHCRAIR